jgi:hypothetical protein
LRQKNPGYAPNTVGAFTSGNAVHTATKSTFSDTNARRAPSAGSSKTGKVATVDGDDVRAHPENV